MRRDQGRFCSGTADGRIIVSTEEKDLMPRNSKGPNWASGRPPENRPAAPTGFEEQLQKLGLNEQTCEASRELKQWCERNKDRCYIPEWLLKRWRMLVDPNLGR